MNTKWRVTVAYEQPEMNWVGYTTERDFIDGAIKGALANSEAVSIEIRRVFPEPVIRPPSNFE